MEETKPFYDLCVPFNKDEKIMRVICIELIDLGYKTIAIDQKFDHSKCDEAKRGSEMFPQPQGIDHLRKEFSEKLKILQRLTILYVDAKVSHAMSVSTNLRKFNIIAAQPKTDAALTHACTLFNGDIITFDAMAGCRLLVNRKAYMVAIQRGMYFEIKYSPAIADSNNRKDMIKLAQNYFIRGKSRNIILSSGAEHEFQLRGPYDVANLSYIFGLSEDQGKNAIDRHCRALFLRAESRRFGKTIMYVKGKGPIVYSDSSDEEEVVGLDEMDTLVAEAFSSDEYSENDEPNKKRVKVDS